MTLIKLGELIEQVNRKNSALQYGIDDVRGVMNTKGMMQTRANVTDRSFDKFYIIEPGEFVFNRRTTRNGERLGLAFNDTNRAYIFTEDYVAFTVKDNEKLLPEYLYIFFLRDEFDRLVRYSSWGSATEFFNWEDMCDIAIDLPPLPIQQKYVNLYNSMTQNQKAYESGLEDLKLTCDAYIDELRRTLPHKAIGEYIEQLDERNTSLCIGVEGVRGISTGKEFIATKADLEGVDLGSYKVVRGGSFAYVSDTSRRGDKISLAFNNTDESYLVSSISTVFRVEKTQELLPEYLMMHFSRSEFNRYARFNSWGSARETFVWEDMCEVKIPIPDIEIQKSIVNIYNAYITRRDINGKLKAQIKDICPILIKGSLEEAGNALKTEAEHGFELCKGSIY